MKRGGIDWSWARIQIGRAAEVPRRLDDDAPSIVFDRAPWYRLLAFAGPPGLVALASLARKRVRVRFVPTVRLLSERR